MQAVVGGCSAAPSGALLQYTMYMGYSSVYPTLYGWQTFTYGAPSGCSGSSSSSSSISGSGCLWYACPFVLTEVVSSSSSSSSGAPATGTYQWVYDMGATPNPKVKLVFVTGTNFLGA